MPSRREAKRPDPWRGDVRYLSSALQVTPSRELPTHKKMEGDVATCGHSMNGFIRHENTDMSEILIWGQFDRLASFYLEAQFEGTEEMSRRALNVRPVYGQKVVACEPRK